MALKERETADGDWIEREHVVGGLRTFSRTIGEGPDVVLAHGAGVSSDYWRPAQKLLAALGPFRVHALDFPGFGRSEDPPWPPELPRLSDHLMAWLDAAVPGPVSLVGQSVGCEISVITAVTLPERVQKLVLAAPSGLPTLGSLTLQLLRAALDAPQERLGLYRVIIPAYFRCGPLRLLRLLYGQKDPTADRLLPQVRQPTLVLRGERDAVVTRKRVATVGRVVGHARLTEVEGAHGCHFTHPSSFVEPVARFLAE